MPRQRINKEMVVRAAFELARAGGLESVTVKDIAARLGCSVQPIYSYCQSMDGLRAEVCAMARDFVREYITAHLDRDDLFRSTGRAYVRLAGEERHVWHMFILCRRDGAASIGQLCSAETDPRMAEAIAAQLGLTETSARQLHLNMLLYTLGLCAVFSSVSPELSVEDIYLQQEQAFDAFLKAAREEDRHGK